MAPKVLHERYELLEERPDGWRAHDDRLDRDVTVRFPASADGRARAAVKLAHPNVVSVLDAGEQDGRPFVVTELVEGAPLADVVERTGPLGLPHAARMARQVLAALEHAHARGLVHGSVGPGTVIVATDGTVKLDGFGALPDMRDALRAPEQRRGQGATKASDVYAVGALVYFALTGHPPDPDGPPPTMHGERPVVPTVLETIVVRAMQHDPAHRFRSAHEMDAAIEATGLTGDPGGPTLVLEPAPTEVLSTPPVAGEHGPTAVVTDDTVKWLVGAGVVLLVAVLALLGFLATRRSPVPAPTPALTPAPTQQTIVLTAPPAPSAPPAPTPLVIVVTPVPTAPPTPSPAPTPSP